MRLFEAMINKSDKSSIKMAFYGAYYTFFKDDLKNDSLQITTNPQDNVLLEAWNYPNVRYILMIEKCDGQVFHGGHCYNCKAF